MGEAKWTVDSCCCGCTLRTGSMIIAILSLIGDVFQLATNVYEATSRHANGSWVSVVIAVLHFIVSVLLIVGIRQEKRNFIMVWVWVSIVMIILSLIICVISFIGLIWGAALVGVAVVLIYVYCVIVVRSYANSISGAVGSPA